VAGALKLGSAAPDRVGCARVGIDLYVFPRADLSQPARKSHRAVAAALLGSFRHVSNLGERDRYRTRSKQVTLMHHQVRDRLVSRVDEKGTDPADVSVVGVEHKRTAPNAR